jgi:hypothetical protein
MESLLVKRLWTCRKTYYGMNSRVHPGGRFTAIGEKTNFMVYVGDYFLGLVGCDAAIRCGQWYNDALVKILVELLKEKMNVLCIQCFPVSERALF